MTVNDIRLMKDDYLNAETLASVMHMDVGKLRYYARTKQLPFPVQESGNTLKFSRIGFLNWHDGKKPEPEKTRTEELLEAMTTELKVHNILLMAVVRNMAPVSYSRTKEKIEEVYRNGLSDDQDLGGEKVQGEAV